MSLAAGLHVTRSGPPDAPPMLFVHGFGCDHTMWRHVAPAFEDDHHVILFDLPGAGGSAGAYDRGRHGTLQGYADDVLALCAELDLRDVVFVGHSVAAMIGVLAAIREPGRFAALVLIGPSPRYVDDDGYTGGFSSADIEELLESLEANYLGWSSAMAPVIAGQANADAGEELTNAFCRMDPEIARRFARVTFLSDNRADLPRVRARTLILQCSDDVIAPEAVGAYVHREIAGSELRRLSATGHCPNLSAPEETIAAIRSFL
jgi:sigma-B regulation protein RsbQ